MIGFSFVAPLKSQKVSETLVQWESLPLMSFPLTQKLIHSVSTYLNQWQDSHRCQ